LRPRFPFIDVRTKGTARGFIAIGSRAVGVVAIGGAAVGIFSCGGFSVGLFSFGGFALALLFALGGVAISPLGLAYGGLAIGLMSVGGLSIGVNAIGGLAIGLLAIKQNCAHCFSYYMPEHAPAFIKYVSGLMNTRLVGVMSIVFWLGFILFMMAQIIFFRKEHNRIKNADPSLVE